MALPQMVGHTELRASLARALRGNILPQSILFQGPEGAGKERLGLWLSQLMLCDNPGDEPCGTCSGCRLVLRLEHPDLHWFFPLPRPDGTTPEKLKERLEEQRAIELQQWRENPFRQVNFEKPASYFLATVRSIQQLASVRPSIGNRKVFVVGDAELMVPQEASPEAANAFLKLLEEPPPTTTIILTSSQPGALLPTIRSRVLALRVGQTAEVDIARMLVSGGFADAEKAAGLARRAGGSVRSAVYLAGLGEAKDPSRQIGHDLLIAALASDPVLRLATANNRRPVSARGEFINDLDSLTEWLRDLAAVAAGCASHVSDQSSLRVLQRAVEQRHVSAAGALAAIDRVTEARNLALGNVNPQLILADLLSGIQRDLTLSSSQPINTQ